MTMGSVLSARTSFSPLSLDSSAGEKVLFFNLHNELNCRILLVEVVQSCCNAKCSMVDALFSHADAILTNEEQKQAEFEILNRSYLPRTYYYFYILPKITVKRQLL